MRIIVYGSLRRKQGNSHWMTNAHGSASTSSKAIRFIIWAITRRRSREGTIHCEVYRINSSILAELDELKSNTKDYKRELIQTPYGSAWIYLYKHSVDGYPRITSGDWLKRLDEQ